jgi:hypothetical protein
MLTYLLGARNQAILALQTVRAVVRGPIDHRSPAKECSGSKMYAFLSQDGPSTFAITSFSARLLEIPFAISKGVVSQLVPLRSAPSGKVMVIS